METQLSMKFQLKTIDHLGVKLYSSFPPVLAELISNAYDADAKEVLVEIDYRNKEVSVSDDGHGMTFDELNKNFLTIGRNRRLNTTGLSRAGRKVTGKKGLGKLAVFGIAEEISISTRSNNILNSFVMNYSEIKNSEENDVYHPRLTEVNEPTSAADGTVFRIKNIKLNSITDIKTLSENLSSRFRFFDEDFKVKIINIDSKEETFVTNELYFNRIDKEFDWTFPDDFEAEISNLNAFKWLNDRGVKGYIITQKTPLQQKHAGFIIYSRGKLVQNKTFFEERSNDNFHSYVTGNFIIDFVDEDTEDDFISTDRKSILWDQAQDLKELKENLNAVVSKLQNVWRRLRNERKESALNEMIPSDYYEDVSPFDKKVLRNLQSQLAKNTESESDVIKIVKIMDTIKHQVQFNSFKEYVDDLNETEITIDNMERISSDWENIEAHEMSKLAVGRIETINRFEAFIKNNVSETKYMQPFLEKFPWILDPRMSTFDREVTFSRILKEAFPDEKLEESNRRIDFICSDANGSVHIIELKRPNIKITSNEITQAMHYATFLTEKRTNIKDIKTFLVSDNIKMDPAVKRIYESLNITGQLEIKTYTDMLDQAKSYHKQFIDAYDKIMDSKSKISLEEFRDVKKPL